MVSERFKYYSNSQMIIDDLTGKHYHGNYQICKLLNKINNKSDKNAEEYFKIKLEYDEYIRVCGEYGINSSTDLKKVLNNLS